MTTRNDFIALVNAELADVAADIGLNPEDKGALFQHWCRQLLGQWNTELDVEPLCTPLSHDGGVDFILEDATNRKWLLGQCHYAGKNGSFNKDKYERLVLLAKSLRNKAALEVMPASDVVKEHLLRLHELMTRQEYSADVFYITMTDASEGIVAQAKQSADELLQEGISLHLWDNKLLREVVSNVDSIDADVIDSVTIPLHAKKAEHFSVTTGGSACYVLCVSGNWAADLYARYQQKLLAWNIRHYLGKKTINKEIAESAVTVPEHFLLLNNGLTAIARRIECKEDGKHKSLVCEKFQIINGGQTVGSLHDARHRGKLDSVQLLMTIVETADTNPTAPFNQSIIRARNTQNSVRLSDFRSNDPIQLWLERHLPSTAQSGIGPSKCSAIDKCRRLLYLPKRRRSGERSRLKLQLEELAKIRYSYIHNPWSAVLDARLLWTKRDDEAGGKYELAFGQPAEGGEGYSLDRTWKNAELLRAVYAVVTFSYIQDAVSADLKVLRDKQKRGEELAPADAHFINLFPRGSYHLLALVGIRQRDASAAAIQRALKDTGTLEKELRHHYDWAKAMFAAAYEPCLDSMRPLQALRSEEVWRRTSKLAAVAR